jgi:hypothetical protein
MCDLLTFELVEMSESEYLNSTQALQIIMTGTWRDTLFVWQGDVTKTTGTTASTSAVETSSDEKEKDGKEHLEWKGTWVACEDCPDARTAPTPNQVAFQASEMNFQVSGKGTNQKEGEASSLWKFELTGSSGWDLGEGDEKKRHLDRRHSVLMKGLPWDPSNEDRTVVAAVGENEFGAFVSAGYLKSGGAIILGRRYLDEGDERSKWSVEELYERVSRTDRGSIQMVSKNQLWFGSEACWRIAPWRMHAEKVAKGRKRKRATKDDDVGEVPSLNIAHQDFSPTLDIVKRPDRSEFDNVDFRELVSNVRWVEQCYGCGKEVRDPSTACCNEVMEYTSEEPNSDIGTAMYCGVDCVKKNVIAQAWAAATKKWAHDMYGTGYFMKSKGDGGFWAGIESDKKASKVMRDVGWKKDWIDYTCFAEAGSVVEYDSE